MVKWERLAGELFQRSPKKCAKLVKVVEVGRRIVSAWSEELCKVGKVGEVGRRIVSAWPEEVCEVSKV